MCVADPDGANLGFGLVRLKCERTEILLELIKPRWFADQSVHAYLTVESLGLRIRVGGDRDDVDITVRIEYAVGARSNSASAFDSIEVRHVNVHKDEVEHFGAQKLECLEAAVQTDGGTCKHVSKAPLEQRA